MKVNGKDYRSVWANFENKKLIIIDQTKLPFLFEIKEIDEIEQLIESIKNLDVRGAPAIGIAAAYAIWLSSEKNNCNKEKIREDFKKLIECRPTAVNLKKGANYVLDNQFDSSAQYYAKAQEFANLEIEACRKIGENGLQIIEKLYEQKKSQINILTHCNAGWLACGDWGTALSPIFAAHRKGIPMHIWVDETRPLNQGSRLTAWELQQENIPYSIIADNTGGLLMMNKMVDLVIVGADRIVANGDFANKIGTYLKALAAHQHSVTFVVAAPMSTFDFETQKGSDINIEQRSGKELSDVFVMVDNKIISAKLLPDTFNAVNYAFDITPAQFVNYYLTEIGIFENTEQIKQHI